jgi:hypothetical protein
MAVSVSYVPGTVQYFVVVECSGQGVGSVHTGIKYSWRDQVQSVSTIYIPLRK